MHIDTTVLSTFTLLWLVIVPTPGPNVLMVSHVAVTRSALHTALAIAGNMAGITLLATLALLGWAALLAAFPWLRLAVSVLGGIYLVYLGWKLMGRSINPPAGGTAAEAPESPRRMIAYGFVTALSNAQAIIFITSIFAVSGLLNANLATGFAAIGIIILCNVSYLSLIAWLFQRPAVRSVYARFRRVMDGLFGGLFMTFGGRLLFRELVK